jgi:hypothetical protein
MNQSQASPTGSPYRTSKEISSYAHPKSSAQWGDRIELFDDIFGSNFIDNIPIVGIVSGGTDYIDRVKYSDFNINNRMVPMIKGVCPFARPAVSMMVTWKMGNMSNTSIQTFFPRYTSEFNKFVICGSHCMPGTQVFNNVFNTSSTVNEDTVKKLTEFVDEHKEGNHYHTLYKQYMYGSQAVIRFNKWREQVFGNNNESPKTMSEVDREEIERLTDKAVTEKDSNFYLGDIPLAEVTERNLSSSAHDLTPIEFWFGDRLTFQ